MPSEIFRRVAQLPTEAITVKHSIESTTVDGWKFTASGEHLVETGPIELEVDMREVRALALEAMRSGKGTARSGPIRVLVAKDADPGYPPVRVKVGQQA